MIVYISKIYQKLGQVWTDITNYQLRVYAEQKKTVEANKMCNVVTLMASANFSSVHLIPQFFWLPNSQNFNEIVMNSQR